MMNANKLIVRVAGKVKYLCVPHQHYSRARPMAVQPMSKNYASDSEFGKKGKEMFSVLPEVINSLVSNPRFAEVPEIANWVRQVLDYNLNGGKKLRGVCAVLAYEMLEKPENITEESLKQARILGISLEMLLAHLIVTDDIIDGSTTRRGFPCWYLNPQVGLGAINDATFIYCSIYETLKHFFGSSPLFPHLVDHFNNTLLYTTIGQHMDFATSHRVNKKDYSMFTMERFNLIGHHKMSYHTFVSPVYLGLVLANKTDKKTYDAVTNICSELGRLYQIQDDYIDCFGDEHLSGKAGTDIQEGKCTWFAVSALKRCSEAQRASFVESFGSKEPKHVEEIKNLYRELNLLNIYKEEEDSLYQNIVKKTNSFPSDTSPALFVKLLDLVYKRKK